MWSFHFICFPTVTSYSHVHVHTHTHTDSPSFLHLAQNLVILDIGEQLTPILSEVEAQCREKVYPAEEEYEGREREDGKAGRKNSTLNVVSNKPYTKRAEVSGNTTVTANAHVHVMGHYPLPTALLQHSALHTSHHSFPPPLENPALCTTHLPPLPSPSTWKPILFPHHPLWIYE